MNAYKIKTIITNDGKIILPPELKSIFNHKVEIIVMDNEQNRIENIQFGVYNLTGVLDEVDIREYAHED